MQFIFVLFTSQLSPPPPKSDDTECMHPQRNFVYSAGALDSHPDLAPVSFSKPIEVGTFWVVEEGAFCIYLHVFLKKVQHRGSLTPSGDSVPLLQLLNMNYMLSSLSLLKCQAVVLSFLIKSWSIMYQRLGFLNAVFYVVIKNLQNKNKPKAFTIFL